MLVQLKKKINYEDVHWGKWTVWRLSSGVILLEKPLTVVLLPVIATLGQSEVGPPWKCWPVTQTGCLAAARVIAVFVLLLQTRLDSLGDKISTYGLCQCSYGKRCQRTTRVVMQCGRLVAWILLLGGVTVLTIALSKWHKCTFLWALPRQTGLNRAALQFLFSFYVCLWHEYLLSAHGSVV